MAPFFSDPGLTPSVLCYADTTFVMTDPACCLLVLSWSLLVAYVLAFELRVMGLACCGSGLTAVMGVLSFQEF